MSAVAAGLGRNRPRGRWRGRVFVGFLALSTAVGFVALGALLLDVFRRGLFWVDGTLLTDPPSSDPQIAGARPAIIATFYLAALLLAFAVPIGVGTAVYLEEYARKERWYNRLLELNIQNLAAVPSIVYGILGLAFLVRGLGLGRVVLAGAMILALARAIGETAPLIMIGAVTYIAFDPTLLGPFTALPIQIYSWTSLPQEEFRNLAAAAIIVLLAILLTMNAFAIWLRNRYERRW